MNKRYCGKCKLSIYHEFEIGTSGAIKATCIQCRGETHLDGSDPRARKELEGATIKFRVPTTPFSPEQETKWTQGEWAVESECWLEDHISIGAPDWGAMILVAYQGDESTANAHLIAAAKTHDKALSMVCSKIPLTPNVFGGEYMISLTQSEVGLIHRTLAKARGEL